MTQHPAADRIVHEVDDWKHERPLAPELTKGPLGDPQGQMIRETTPCFDEIEWLKQTPATILSTAITRLSID